MVDVLIVGAGPCGLFTTFYAGMRGLKVHLMDALPQLGGQLTALYPEKYIYDMPGFPKVLAKDLVQGCTDQALQFKPKITLDVTAEHIRGNYNDGFSVHLSNSEEITTKTIVIAGGIGRFQPTKLGIENEEAFLGKGLCYGVQDPSIYENKIVHIVGAGDSAFDWACHLAPIAKSVEIIHRRDVFKAHESTIQNAHDLGVKIRTWTKPTQLLGHDALNQIEITNVKSQEVDRLDTQALIVNIGFKASLGPLKDWGLELDKNQICVNEYGQTNKEGVFAVGDIATYPSKLKLIATGMAEGALAVCKIKTILDPKSRLFPGHSTDMM